MKRNGVWQLQLQLQLAVTAPTTSEACKLTYNNGQAKWVKWSAISRRRIEMQSKVEEGEERVKLLPISHSNYLHI